MRVARLTSLVIPFQVFTYLLHGPSMLPDKAKFVVCSIISLALSFWMKHLIIGQLQKPANFSTFHWSTSRSQAFNGNGFIHHIGCLITLSDRNGPILVLVSTDFWPYRMLNDPIRPQRTYSWPSLSEFDYILDLVSADFSGPNHRIGQGCAGCA